MLELARLQRSIWSALTARAADPAATSNATAHAGILQSIHGDARGAAYDRLELYANMYVQRLLDALAADFPRLAAVCGAHAFRDLGAAYLADHPSTAPSLRHLGRALPQFLRARADHGPAWHADLAALEWARLDVHDRADEHALNLVRLGEAAASGFAGLRLAPITAHVRVFVHYDVRAVWRSTEPVDAPRRDPGTIVVWRRPDYTVHHRLVSSGEAELLDALDAGLDFDALCAQLGRGHADEDAARRALEVVGSWTADGLLREHVR